MRNLSSSYLLFFVTPPLRLYFIWQVLDRYRNICERVPNLFHFHVIINVTVGHSVKIILFLIGEVKAESLHLKLIYKSMYVGYLQILLDLLS